MMSICYWLSVSIKCGAIMSRAERDWTFGQLPTVANNSYLDASCDFKEHIICFHTIMSAVWK